MKTFKTPTTFATRTTLSASTVTSEPVVVSWQINSRLVVVAIPSAARAPKIGTFGRVSL